MADTFQTIDGRPIYYTDKSGSTHVCEGADVHPRVRLLWTLCERDVPSNAAFLPGADDRITCKQCLQVVHITNEEAREEVQANSQFGVGA